MHAGGDGRDVEWYWRLRGIEAGWSRARSTLNWVPIQNGRRTIVGSKGPSQFDMTSGAGGNGKSHLVSEGRPSHIKTGRWRRDRLNPLRWRHTHPSRHRRSNESTAAIHGPHRVCYAAALTGTEIESEATTGRQLLIDEDAGDARLVQVYCHRVVAGIKSRIRVRADKLHWARRLVTTDIRDVPSRRNVLSEGIEVILAGQVYRAALGMVQRCPGIGHGTSAPAGPGEWEPCAARRDSLLTDCDARLRRTS